MKIGNIIKNGLLGRLDWATIQVQSDLKFELFKTMYFLRWKSEIPEYEKIANYLRNYVIALQKKAVYGHISLYTFSSLYLFIYWLSSTIFFKSATDYISIILSSLAIILSLLIKFVLERRSRIKYSVSFLIDNLITIVILLEIDDGIFLQRFSNFEIGELLKVKENLERMTSNIQNTKTRKIESYGEKYGDLIIKKWVLNYLEEAAQIVERYVPKRLRSKDVMTDEWFKNSMRQVAAALREKKMWVLTPKRDTNDILVIKMISTLTCIVDGDWDALERVKLAEVSPFISIRLFISILLRILKTLFIAMLPLLGFIGLQLTPFALSGTMRDYVTIGVFLWLGVSLMMSIDANFGTKLSLLGGLRDLLSSKDILSKLESGENKCQQKMGESRTTLRVVFGLLYTSVDRCIERNKAHFCLSTSIKNNSCLLAKL